MMKLKITILVFIVSALMSCNDESKYLRLINQENTILNSEIDRNYNIISTFWDNNKVKYGPWRYRCEEIIELRDTVMNNRTNENVLHYSIDHLKNITKWLDIEKDNDYNNFLAFDIDINDKIENALFINKFLTVSNSYIGRIVFMSNMRDYRFTSMSTIVIYDYGKSTYKLGEDVEARIFISAVDTTVTPIIKMADGEYIDSFDGSGRGIYKTKALKKGINIIEGTYVIKHDYNHWVDSFPFYTEFLVK